MSFRIEIDESGIIQIQRYDRGRWHHTPFESLDSALIVIKFMLRRDLAKARAEKFEPQLIREARKEFSKLQEKSPYGKKR